MSDATTQLALFIAILYLGSREARAWFDRGSWSYLGVIERGVMVAAFGGWCACLGLIAALFWRGL